MPLLDCISRHSGFRVLRPFSESAERDKSLVVGVKKSLFFVFLLCSPSALFEG
jgi:hypothetical protein